MAGVKKALASALSELEAGNRQRAEQLDDASGIGAFLGYLGTKLKLFPSRQLRTIEGKIMQLVNDSLNNEPQTPQQMHHYTNAQQQPHTAPGMHGMNAFNPTYPPPPHQPNERPPFHNYANTPQQPHTAPMQGVNTFNQPHHIDTFQMPQTPQPMHGLPQSHHNAQQSQRNTQSYAALHAPVPAPSQSHSSHTGSSQRSETPSILASVGPAPDIHESVPDFNPAL